MNYKHIIWDWNGTLLDDRCLCIESINSLLMDRGIPVLNEKDYLAFFDFPVKDYYLRAGFDFTEEDFKTPALQFIDLYDKGRKECHMQENALMVLNYFKDKRISQSLLSASEEGILNDMVDHFSLRKYFCEVAGLNNHYAASKVDLGRSLLEKLSIPPDQILMIGDTCHDYEVAQSLGVDIILYDQGHFPEYRLKNCESPIISNLIDLQKI